MARFISEFGDAALLSPGSALVLVYLIARGAPRAAKLWASTLALCVGVTIALKFGFQACGGHLPLLDIRSPSGHASLSATFYGSCAVMAAGDKGGPARLAALAAGAVLVLAVAASRVAQGLHTVSEVVTGIAVGAACAAWFGRRYLARPSAPVSLTLGMAVFAVVAVALHGAHVDIEGAIIRAADLFRSDLRICG